MKQLEDRVRSFQISMIILFAALGIMNIHSSHQRKILMQQNELIIKIFCMEAIEDINPIRIKYSACEILDELPELNDHES